MVSSAIIETQPVFLQSFDKAPKWISDEFQKKEFAFSNFKLIKAMKFEVYFLEVKLKIVLRFIWSKSF